MSEQLLTVLKFCLLALLYLFFFRVVRAVWAEINPPKPGRAPAPAPAAPAARAPSRRQARKAAKAAPLPAPVVVGAGVAAPAPAPAAAPHLVVLEPADQRGRTYPLGDELTVGRAAGCQVTIDDTYVSQIHARVFAREGQYLVEDLGSTNGTYLNRKKVSGPMVMQPGDQLQVGNTVMVLR